MIVLVPLDETNITGYLETIEPHINCDEVDVYMSLDQQNYLNSQIRYKIGSDTSVKCDKIQHGFITYNIVTYYKLNIKTS